MPNKDPSVPFIITLITVVLGISFFFPVLIFLFRIPVSGELSVQVLASSVVWLVVLMIALIIWWRPHLRKKMIHEEEQFPARSDLTPTEGEEVFYGKPPLGQNKPSLAALLSEKELCFYKLARFTKPRRWLEYKTFKLTDIQRVDIFASWAGENPYFVVNRVVPSRAFIDHYSGFWNKKSLVEIFLAVKKKEPSVIVALNDEVLE